MLSKPPRGYSFERSLKEFGAVKILSTGRFGCTLLAAHPKTDKFVCVTSYHKSLLQDSFQQHLPFREKKLLENLDHPCVHKILATLSDQTSLYFVFDSLPLSTLSAYLFDCAKGGGLGEKLSIHVAASILSALKHCHSQRILHRNLHPESVLLDWKGNVKIAGWSFAKVVEERTYTLCGHVDYLCPEALLGDAGYGKGLDFWALGVLIFEMLVGRSPFVPVESQWQQLERERGGAGAHKVREISSDHSLGLLDESTHSILDTSSHSHSSSPSVASSSDLQTVENILYGEPHFPIHLPHSAKAIVKGLCQKKVAQRLGCQRRNSFEEISSQQWFGQWAELDWKAIEKGSSSPPPLPAPLALPPCLKTVALAKADSTLSQQPVVAYRGYNCPDWAEFELCATLKAGEPQRSVRRILCSSPGQSQDPFGGAASRPLPGLVSAR
jgi:serine/threonine protein kinase